METKMTTDTPRTDACPHCGLKRIPMRFDDGRIRYYCGSGESWQSPGCQSTARIKKLEAEVERLKVINADMRNFLSKAIHNEGFNEEQALKFIYQ